jgi:hypothetical protein
LFQHPDKLKLIKYREMVDVLSQKLLDELTTKADNLFTSLDGEAYEDVQDFMDETREFLDGLINFLEGIGGRVEGMQYTDGRGVYRG